MILQFFNPQYRTHWSVDFSFFLSWSLISFMCTKK